MAKKKKKTRDRAHDRDLAHGTVTENKGAWLANALAVTVPKLWGIYNKNIVAN